MSTRMDNFVGLSALLTGIAADKLAPPIDPNNIKQVYLDYIGKAAGADFDRLLEIFAKNSGLQPAEIADIIFNKSGVEIRFLARSVMLAWYLGSWYAPADLEKYSQPAPQSAPIPSQVISALAYTQGWAWSVAQAHPMGYSNFQFGYWSAAPPSLADFVGGGQT